MLVDIPLSSARRSHTYLVCDRVHLKEHWNRKYCTSPQPSFWCKKILNVIGSHPAFYHYWCILYCEMISSLYGKKMGCVEGSLHTVTQFCYPLLLPFRSPNVFNCVCIILKLCKDLWKNTNAVTALKTCLKSTYIFISISRILLIAGRVWNVAPAMEEALLYLIEFFDQIKWNCIGQYRAFCTIFCHVCRHFSQTPFLSNAKVFDGVWIRFCISSIQVFLQQSYLILPEWTLLSYFVHQNRKSSFSKLFPVSN